MHNTTMGWKVVVHDDFLEEIRQLPEDLQDELFAHALLLQDRGPTLGRPTVDTLKGSRFPKMKELRFFWQEKVWRIAFAFDPGRKAILLAGGEKGGKDQRRFYGRLIAKADRRFQNHLDSLGEPARKR